ncbi:hypothetical protein ABGV40_05855 [Paenibacillus amylolyticus]|uniref:hypothetical protein n=1 Tax=Paenibacillus amylolyticus TaxID=1451 RepID=UPI00324278DD
MSTTPQNYGKRWTKEEEEQIKVFAFSLSSQQELALRGPEFAASLGRPVSTVQFKVEKLRNWYSRNTNKHVK